MEKAEIEVDGVEQFRRVCLVTSLVCSATSAIILVCHPP